MTVADIRVLEDFLPMYDEVAAVIANEPLLYGSRSNSRTDPHGHWSISFADAGHTNLADVSGDLARDTRRSPISKAWEYLRDRLLPDCVLIRCYMNAYTYGTEGYFHADSQRRDERTVVVFMNDYWEPDWAGETVFLDAGAEISKSVLPKRNRAVVFPSEVQHAGRGVSRKCTVLRRTLIFKARRRRSGDFERLSAFLRDAGATRLTHKSGTLHDHLARTFSLLEGRGFDRTLCLGGGLHSIYGTNAYRSALLSAEDRDRVAAAFGGRASALAELFCRLERPKTLESPLRLTDEAALVELRTQDSMTIDRATFDDLRLIECANLTDQNELNKFKTLRSFWHQSRDQTDSPPVPPLPSPSASTPSSSPSAPS